MYDAATLERIENARDEYAATGTVRTDAPVRATVLESWKRSRLYGLDTHAIRPVRLAEGVGTGQLSRAAQPYAADFYGVLDDVPGALTLSDAEGCIQDRWVSCGSVAALIDAYCLAPGYSVAESVLGTCGTGISLETGRSALVLGPEHFGAGADPMASASAVVRHPVTRRVVGTIALTCRLEHASPLLLRWVQDQADKLERRIRQTVSGSEQLLFDTFLLAGRDAQHPILCLDDRTIVSNAAAARLTGELGQATLWELASGTVQSGIADTVEVVVPASGRTLAVACEPIRDGARVVGAVLRVAPVRLRRTPSARPDPVDAGLLPRMAGRSAAWLTMCRQLREAGDLLLVGGPGSGKSAILDDLVLDHAPVTRVGPDGLGVALAAPGGLVVLDDLDDDGAARVIAGHPGGPRPRVLASTGESRRAVIETWPGTVVRVAALHERTGDVPLLLDALTRAATASPVRPRWSPEAVQVMSRVRWAANVRSLSQVVTSTLRRCTGPVIGPADLPADVVAMAARRPLYGLEHLEARAIAAAIEEAGGNKKLAADRLGIARSTLYRKVRALGLDLHASNY